VSDPTVARTEGARAAANCDLDSRGQCSFSHHHPLTFPHQVAIVNTIGRRQKLVGAGLGFDPSAGIESDGLPFSSMRHRRMRSARAPDRRIVPFCFNTPKHLQTKSKASPKSDLQTAVAFSKIDSG
jgi:hypothetical protein